MTEESSYRLSHGEITRRSLLGRSLGVGAAVVLPGVLAACGGTSSSSGAAAKPRRGGRLRIAIVGGGSQEQVHPFKGTGTADVNRRLQLWDSLFRQDSQDALFKPYLAERVEPNRDGTVWEITLRSGVVAHNGRTLTADDAVWSLQQVNNVAAGAYGSPFAPYMDLNTGLRTINKTTFQMTLKQPIGDLSSIARDTSSVIAPRDWDANPHKPIGTGPFEFVSFTPGQQSLFRRNPNYWIGGGKPYIDELQLISIPDASARTNALTVGQVDGAENFDFLQAKTNATNPAIKLLNAPSEWTVPFICRYDMAPFHSNDVRLAMKYAIDRPVVTNTCYYGFGNIGNDEFGKNGPSLYYNSDLPQRHYDPERAKSLLAKAGYPDGIKPTLVLSPGSGLQGPAGIVTTAAQSYQQQAKAAGIDFTITNVPNMTTTTLVKNAFSATWWSPGVPFVLNWFLSDSTYNEGFHSPKWDQLYREALGTVDLARQKQLWDEVQAIFWQSSGHIIWGFYNLIDGLSPKVRGAYQNAWSFSSYDFKSYWLA